MITVQNRFFPLRTAACFFVEGGIIILSVIASFLILSRMGDIAYIRLNEAVARGIIIAIFCQSCMYMLDMYDLKNSQSWGELFFSLVFAVGVVCIGVSIISYVVPQFGIDGRMYYMTILFVAIFLFLWRFGFDYYIRWLAPREKILIVGSGDIARLVAGEIRKRDRFGFHLVGFVGHLEEGKPAGDMHGEIIGDYSSLKKVVREYNVRRLVVASNERRGEYPVKELLSVRTEGCKITEWPVFFEYLAGRIPIDNLTPSYFIFNEGFRKSESIMLLRKTIGIILAGFFLLILAPVLILVAMFIKFDSSGPVLYSQDRVGQKGKHFRIYKFRSMRDNAEENGPPRWATKDDPRITRVGRILRKLRVDEIPQLFNILRGDLSFVGPRPERPEFVEKLQNIYPYYSLRHTVKPGLTGWAQVSFMYSGTFEESKEKLQYDLFYIKNMSIKLDLWIIFKTIKIVLLGRGAL